jgi:hypothetical protein
MFPNIKKCTMYFFVNHDSHMKMMIRYCAFFCVFFSLFFCAYSQLFLFACSKLLCCICILHQILLSCILISKLKAPSFSHILCWYSRFLTTWSSITLSFEVPYLKMFVTLHTLPFAIWFNRNNDVVVVCSLVKCHSRDMCQIVESLHHIHMCAVDCMVLCFEVF